jgi:pSer/pThr/pTyr-binding forkhead associated (FHA) protein
VAAVSQVPQYALRFISGKYQGGEFPLRMDREIVIGRSSELDMVLVEDMVSRKHAKISTAGGQITIQDLGSTNGTFVNGEKIKKVRLKEGDRILIGTSIIKLVAVDGSGMAQLTEAEARSRMDQNANRRPSGPGRPMSGSIEEIPLPDLLQLLSTSRKSGVLSIRGEAGLGKIYLRKGQIYFASIDDSFDLTPRKAVYRLLTWQSGTFELEPPDERDVLEEIKESTEALLMEGVRQLDELRRIEAELPPRQTLLAMIHPLQPPLRDLSPAELDVFQTVLNYGTLQAVLDKTALTDLETAQAVLSLMQRGYIAVTE